MILLNLGFLGRDDLIRFPLVYRSEYNIDLVLNPQECLSSMFVICNALPKRIPTCQRVQFQIRLRIIHFVM